MDEIRELTIAEMSLVTGATADLPPECSAGTMIGAAIAGGLGGAIAGPATAVIGAALGAAGAAMGCTITWYYFSKH